MCGVTTCTLAEAKAAAARTKAIEANAFSPQPLRPPVPTPLGAVGATPQKPEPISRDAVDFPQPFAPTIPYRSPALNCIDAPSKSVWSP